MAGAAVAGGLVAGAAVTGGFVVAGAAVVAGATVVVEAAVVDGPVIVVVALATDNVVLDDELDVDLLDPLEPHPASVIAAIATAPIKTRLIAPASCLTPGTVRHGTTHPPMTAGPEAHRLDNCVEI